jgi:hypothetical protein
MSHLRARPVQIPDLMFAPRCVSMEVVRSHWSAIASVATAPAHSTRAACGGGGGRLRRWSEPAAGAEGV